jgi:hypothetical protein
MRRLWQMALKAFILDDKNIPHLMIGLSRTDMEAIERGEVYVLPAGPKVPLTEESDIIVIFEETDEELVKRMEAGVARSAESPARKKRVSHKHTKARK